MSSNIKVKNNKTIQIPNKEAQTVLEAGLLKPNKSTYDLYIAIEFLTKKLQALDLSTLSDKQKQNIGKFIKSIIFDLIEFKDQVFIKQEANNIFYINASIASSCIQIGYIFNEDK